MMKSNIFIVQNIRVDGARGILINAYLAASVLAFALRQGWSVNR